jgi:hypothetical protein
MSSIKGITIGEHLLQGTRPTSRKSSGEKGLLDEGNYSWINQLVIQIESYIRTWPVCVCVCVFFACHSFSKGQEIAV